LLEASDTLRIQHAELQYRNKINKRTAKYTMYTH